MIDLWGLCHATSGTFGYGLRCSCRIDFLPSLEFDFHFLLSVLTSRGMSGVALEAEVFTPAAWNDISSPAVSLLEAVSSKSKAFEGTGAATVCSLIIQVSRVRGRVLHSQHTFKGIIQWYGKTRRITL